MKMSMSSTIQIQVDEIRSLVAFIDGVIQEFDDVVTEIGFNGTLISFGTLFPFLINFQTNHLPKSYFP